MLGRTAEAAKERETSLAIQKKQQSDYTKKLNHEPRAAASPDQP